MLVRLILWFFPLFLGASACTKPPDVPRFPERPTTGPRRVLLGEDITGRDIREIFQAVNQNGKLDTLKPFLEAPDDATLAQVAQLAMATLTPSRWEGGSLVELLRGRLRARAFTPLREAAQRWRLSPGFSAERRFLLASLAQASVPELALRGKDLLSLDWHRSLARVSREAIALSGTLPEASAEAVLEDIRRFLRSTASDRLVALADLIDEQSGGQSFLKAVAEARAEAAAAPFLGLGKGFRNLLRLPPGPGAPPPTVEKLFELVPLLDAPSAGIFTTAQKKFQERDNTQAREFATLFRPNLESAVSGFLREYLKQPLRDGVPSDKKFWTALISNSKAARPSKEFGILFGAVRESVEQVCGAVHRTESSTDFFLFNLPIFINTYALSRWIEATLADNKRLVEDLPEKDFAEKLWAMPVTVSSLKLDLLAGDGSLLADVKKELEALGLKEFAETLQQALKREGYGDFLYPFPEQTTALPLKEALREAVKAAEKTRPFGDTAPLLRAVLHKVTRTDGDSRLTLDKLETRNMLDAINRWAGALDRESWVIFKGILFDDLQLANLGVDTKRILLSLYEPGSALRVRVDKMLGALPGFLELDRRAEPDLPSVFEMYSRILGFTAPREVRWVGASLRWLSESTLLSTRERAGRREADFPALYATAENGMPVARAAYGLAVLPASARVPFLAPASELFRTKDGVSGLGLILENLRIAVNEEPLGATEFIRHFAEQAYRWATDTDVLEAAERDWVIRFVSRGHLRTLWSFLSRHSTLTRFHDLVLAVKRAVLDLSFREAASLLLEIQDERFQLLGKLLVEWEASGQLMECLIALETLTAP